MNIFCLKEEPKADRSSWEDEKIESYSSKITEHPGYHDYLSLPSKILILEDKPELNILHSLIDKSKTTKPMLSISFSLSPFISKMSSCIVDFDVDFLPQAEGSNIIIVKESYHKKMNRMTRFSISSAASDAILSKFPELSPKQFLLVSSIPANLVLSKKPVIPQTYLYLHKSPLSEEEHLLIGKKIKSPPPYIIRNGFCAAIFERISFVRPQDQCIFLLFVSPVSSTVSQESMKLLLKVPIIHDCVGHGNLKRRVAKILSLQFTHDVFM
ncbi:hypothetical protein ADUPG1_005937 [Aduncisulcus paluster]|uniref:Uncharacterized protein n=1 Tax=Aduncisulcus paluster TaxID=2918883 RepID=A0ABQ5KG67_9EUKA|nr:hypothetical protein ADUPG1_005937 [Aduncisulcus paluster]